ncbi:hypothetical protein AMK59_5652 [Oryctes borbonicus]|uniref:Uncharacterized protein n=1 Tax=Oryctes borbonicus TaxID=1629725 RepID=A0A0T6B3Z0_9SCAR|nr:hypothetical protein AMK59_5652 [Oryctes borbonicus]
MYSFKCRLYFEDKLAQLDYQAGEETKALRDKLTSIAEENKQLKSKLSNVMKEKQNHEKKITQQASKLLATINELNEERQLGKALRNNQQQWQAKVAKLEEKLTEIKTTKGEAKSREENNSASLEVCKEQIPMYLFDN